MKREALTEREIADLIASAYEEWAAPDARRLAAIEQRLLNRPRRRIGSAWWWLFAILATGAASALWWTVDYYSGKERVTPVPVISAQPAVPAKEEPPVNPARSVGAESKRASEPEPKQGPVIYRREH